MGSVRAARPRYGTLGAPEGLFLTFVDRDQLVEHRHRFGAVPLARIASDDRSVAAALTEGARIVVDLVFASGQGDYGLMRRIEIEAEARALRQELDVLQQDVAALSNKARRLSDRYLDLDLLDEQARSVLGYVRGDEIVLR